MSDRGDYQQKYSKCRQREEKLKSELAALKSRLEEAERVIDFMAAEIQRGIGCYACTYEKTCELMVDADECEQWTWRGEQEGSE